MPSYDLKCTYYMGNEYVDEMIARRTRQLTQDELVVVLNDHISWMREPNSVKVVKPVTQPTQAMAIPSSSVIRATATQTVVVI